MTTPEPIDQAIRDELTRDLDTSFFVEAGAGTGKTRILVDRVLEVLRRGCALADQIIVITFTEKAAGELRGRIRAELHQGLNEDDGVERRRLERALRSLDSAHIETIHAFASSLLREHPLEARVDPTFEQLDEIGNELDFRERWIDWLWQAKAEDARTVERCLRLGMKLDDVRLAAENIGRFREVPCTKIARAATTAAVSHSRAVQSLAELEPLTADCHEEGDHCVTQFAALQEAVAALSGLPPETLEAALCALAGERRPTNRGDQRNWEPRDSLRRLREGIADTVAELLGYRQEVHTEAFGRLVGVLEQFVDAAATARHRDGKLNFEDLLIEARRLLVEHPQILERLKRRYRYIFIDEFQDTDPLQAELIFLLAGDPKDNPPDPDWRSVGLTPGKLLVVGDPKQSIYRFRRADIDAYMTARALFASHEDAGRGAGVRDITQNFRSTPEVLEYVNGAFAEIITPAAGYPTAQPEYRSIEASRASSGAAGVHYLYPAPNTPPNLRIDPFRELEAQAIARLIGNIVGNWDVEAPRGQPRKARFSDISILVQSRIGIEMYVDALTQARVPHVLDGGRTFFQRPEVRDLGAILRAIDDPSDTVSLVAALKCEAFACSDVELLEYRNAGGRLSLNADPTIDHPVADALRRLGALRAQRSEMALPSFVDLVLRESFLVESLLWAGEEQRAANLRLVVDRAAEFAASETDALRPFARWLSQRQSEAAAEQESQLSEVEDDVVRILTVHGAKGLEFPIVILAKLSRGESNEGGRVVVDRAANALELRLGRQGLEFLTGGFDEAWAREAVYDEAETKRLLYVAATRARDHLVVSAFRHAENPGLHNYLPALPEADEVYGQNVRVGPFGARLMPETELRDVVPPAVGPEPPDEDLAGDWGRRHEVILARLAAGPRYVAPSAVTADEVKEPRETEPKDRSEAERDLDVLGEGERSLGVATGGDGYLFAGSSSARQRGALVHEVLYRCDLSDLENGRQWSERLCRERGVPELVDEVQGHVANALTSDLIERALSASRLERELPIAWFDGDRYIEGFADLAFEEPDGWVVIDYKTDKLGALGASTLLKRYAPQIGLYRNALEAVGLRVNAAGLLLTRSGEAAFVAH